MLIGELVERLMIYVLMPPAKTAWSVLPNAFAEILRREWPDATIRFGSADAPNALGAIWAVQVDGETLEGTHQRSGQASYLDGPLEAIATFAAWWRTQVPGEQPLILCDEDYSVVVDLPVGVHASDVLAQLSGGLS